MYRKKLKAYFDGFYQTCHKEGKERILREEEVFRKNLETDKLTIWTEKVDQLMLYMGQLENKIKDEVQAREKLSITYENSLHKGAQQLNSETELLSDNALVKEISIVVAKHLMQKGMINE